jgi:hypothetical protein
VAIGTDPIIFSVRFQAKTNVIPSEQFHHPTGKCSKEAHSIPLAHINIVCVTGHSPDLYPTQGGGVAGVLRGCGFPTSYVVVFLCSEG